MQAEVTILERIAQSYKAHHGVRLLCILLVLGAATSLFLLADGFPPFAWRLLAQTLPQIPALVAVRGQAALLALVGLILLSLTLLLAWGTILWLTSRMLAYWWYERQELRSFAADAAEAHYLAENEEVAYTPYFEQAEYAEDEQDDEENDFYQDEQDANYTEDEDDPYQDESEDYIQQSNYGRILPLSLIHI